MVESHKVAVLAEQQMHIVIQLKSLTATTQQQQQQPKRQIEVLNLASWYATSLSGNSSLPAV